ncbi:DUF3102 domain-containing protein [Desulfosporosinus sp. SB140]
MRISARRNLSPQEGNPNSSPVTNLTYSQALILLGISEE